VLGWQPTRALAEGLLHTLEILKDDGVH